MQNRQDRLIGQYRIVREIGRGGMAEVYLAWQPSLERHVALKVLPQHFLHDSQFLIRFQREAKAAARLSHPNIVHIYDTGVADGKHYIAMEYLAGGSLRDRLSSGRLGLEETEGILAHVAAGLDYAHDHGLIHRDIKPANILFDADGRPKLTDFGIARPGDGTQLTRTGIIMGTPEYMAPEQAEGRAVDHRADLYALGVVLYQMLTGQAPFRGTTPHATLHAVIYEPPPPPRQINPDLPGAVEKVVLKALAKRPAERYQRGSEMMAALRAALPSATQPRTATQRRSPLVWILTGAAVALALLLVMLILLSAGGAPEETAVAEATHTTAVEPPTPVPATFTLAPPPASPSALPTGISTPPSRTPAAPTSTAVPPSDTTAPPTETPIPPTATTTVPTEPPPPPTREASARFGRLAFTSNRDGNPEIYVLDLARDTPNRLTSHSANDWLPAWSPDGQRLAFTSNRRESNYDLWLMDSSGGGLRPLVATDAWDEYARWSPDGERLALSTTALTQGVANSEIFVRRANGDLVRQTNSAAEDQWPNWAPDGRIIYSEGFKGSSNWDVYITNPGSGSGQIWLGGPTCDVQPAWSPDGQWVAFVRISQDTNGNGQIDQDDAGDIWVGKAGGGGLRSLTSGVWGLAPAWSPDSRWVAFAQVRDSDGNGRSDAEDAADIWAVPVGEGNPVPLVQSPHRDGDPSWTR